MVFEDFGTFEQRAITLRNALHGIVYRVYCPANNTKHWMFKYITIIWRFIYFLYTDKTILSIFFHTVQWITNEHFYSSDTYGKKMSLSPVLNNAYILTFSLYGKCSCSSDYYYGLRLYFIIQTVHYIANADH